MGSEQLCLRWNDFEANISSAFKDLRDDKDFFDVTLACDNEQIMAHKVILSACRPFFRTILRRNIHQHPLLYLKGVRYLDLQSVLDFMYHGEVSVAQDDLNSFLAVAEELRVKGLTQNDKTDKISKDTFNNQTVGEGFTQQKSRTIPHKTSTSSASNNFKRKTSTDEVKVHEISPVKTEPRDFSISIPQYETHTQSLSVQEDQPLVYQEEAYEDYSYDDEAVMIDAGFENSQGKKFFLKKTCF